MIKVELTPKNDKGIASLSFTLKDPNNKFELDQLDEINRLLVQDGLPRRGSFKSSGELVIDIKEN